MAVHPFTAITIAAYGLLSSFTWFRITHLLQHHFSYSLDDTYIHLALAQGIAHGVYGINSYQTSSPSSSVLWPLLLVPFMRFSWSVWSPFLLNVVVALISCVLLSRFVRRWYLDAHPLSLTGRIVLSILLVVTANLVGLTFLGMEHGLQVMLTIGCCDGLMHAFHRKPIPPYAIVMAAFAPAVRYEDILFTLCICIACFLQRRRAMSVFLFVASLLPLAALALFLHAHGLPLLPNSVLLKSGANYQGPGAFFKHLRLAQTNLRFYSTGRVHFSLYVITALLLFWTWKLRTDRVHAIILGSVLSCSLLMIVAGPFGSFYRYDVFFRLAGFLTLLAVIGSTAARVRPVLVLGIAAVAASGYILAIRDAPRAAHEIYLQQWQMARLIHDYVPGNIAVNDIGCVSFLADRRYEVVDLYGLASNEALRTIKDTAWLDSVTRSHHVPFVMIYPEWFPAVPATWRSVAVLHSGDRRRSVVLGYPDVSIYATSTSNTAELRRQLESFALTLPPGASLTFTTQANQVDRAPVVAY